MYIFNVVCTNQTSERFLKLVCTGGGACTDLKKKKKDDDFRKACVLHVTSSVKE